jgi:hypothetical protein
MGSFSSNDSDANARRVRLRAKPAAVSTVYGTGLINPLRATNGMVWPYQPTITYAQDVSYTNIDLVHTNQEMYAYTRTNAVKLTIDGQFSVQNQTEGVYAVACIHFLQTVTKMYFGQATNTTAPSGTPPPVLLFDAYGDYMFNQLPVIVTNFGVTFPNDVDYVPIDTAYLSTTSGATAISTTLMFTSVVQSGGNNSYLDTQKGSVWLPALFNISVSLTVQNTPSVLRTVFNLDQFRSGALMTQSQTGSIQGGWI